MVDIRSYDGEPETRINETEFKIDEVDSKNEMVWLRDEANKKRLDVSVKPVEPDSQLAEKIRRLSSHDYVTCSLSFYRPEPGAIGWWQFDTIEGMRTKQGNETNIFSR
jgi:hypothetical protein